ncbi:MAG: coiled-coil domain-containing protein [Eggerthellaceae bacterium]
MNTAKRTLNALCTYGAACLACVVSLALAGALLAPGIAFADPKADLAAAQEDQRESAAASQQAQADLAAAQDAIEQSAADYEQAQKKADQAQAKIDANVQLIKELEEQIPAQKEASDQAFSAMYKMQQDGLGLLDVLLSSKDLGSFFTNFQYLNHVQARNLANIRRLSSMKSQLTQAQSELEEQKARAEAEKAAAKEALQSAQAARVAAQKAAAEQQRREVEAARKVEKAKKALKEAKDQAAKKAAEEAARKAQEEADRVQAESVAASGESNESSSLAKEPANESEPMETPTADNADWSTTKSAFVKKWAPRIDVYLGNAPLGGQGKTFAAAAWDYGVDPRWSPAISCVESTKGRYCFRSHNAWGWGNVSWSSWEEAIYAHVGGLARGYGYTVTQAAARKYCPPNWRHWYNTCVSEMAKI